MLKSFSKLLLKLIVALVVIALIAVAGLWLYLKFSPQTGATPSEDQLKTYQSLENHDGDHFVNLDAVSYTHLTLPTNREV